MAVLLKILIKKNILIFETLINCYIIKKTAYN